MHIPFRESERRPGATAERWRLDDLDVLDPTGLYDTVLKPTPPRGEIGAAMTHAKAWLLTHMRGRPMLVLEDDVQVARELPRVLDSWLRVHGTAAAAHPTGAHAARGGWDWLHVGCNTDHGGRTSPVSETEGCRNHPAEITWYPSRADCYSGWVQSETGVDLQQRYGLPPEYSLWRPKHAQHGFLGYLLAPAGATKMVLALPAGADVDNWYAQKLMNSGEAEGAGRLFMGVNRSTESYTIWPNMLSGSRSGSDTHEKIPW